MSELFPRLRQRRFFPTQQGVSFGIGPFHSCVRRVHYGLGTYLHDSAIYVRGRFDGPPTVSALSGDIEHYRRDQATVLWRIRPTSPVELIPAGISVETFKEYPFSQISGDFSVVTDTFGGPYETLAVQNAWSPMQPPPASPAPLALVQAYLPIRTSWNSGGNMTLGGVQGTNNYSGYWWVWMTEDFSFDPATINAHFSWSDSSGKPNPNNLTFYKVPGLPLLRIGRGALTTSYSTTPAANWDFTFSAGAFTSKDGPSPAISVSPLKAYLNEIVSAGIPSNFVQFGANRFSDTFFRSAPLTSYMNGQRGTVPAPKAFAKELFDPEPVGSLIPTTTNVANANLAFLANDCGRDVNDCTELPKYPNQLPLYVSRSRHIPCIFSGEKEYIHTQFILEEIPYYYYAFTPGNAVTGEKGLGIHLAYPSDIPLYTIPNSIFADNIYCVDKDIWFYSDINSYPIIGNISEANLVTSPYIPATDIPAEDTASLGGYNGAPDDPSYWDLVNMFYGTARKVARPIVLHAMNPGTAEPGDLLMVYGPLAGNQVETCMLGNADGVYPYHYHFRVNERPTDDLIQFIGSLIDYDPQEWPLPDRIWTTTDIMSNWVGWAPFSFTGNPNAHCHNESPSELTITITGGYAGETNNISVSNFSGGVFIGIRAINVVSGTNGSYNLQTNAYDEIEAVDVFANGTIVLNNFPSPILIEVLPNSYSYSYYSIEEWSPYGYYIPGDLVYIMEEFTDGICLIRRPVAYRQIDYYSYYGSSNDFPPNFPSIWEKEDTYFWDNTGAKVVYRSTPTPAAIATAHYAYSWILTLTDASTKGLIDNTFNFYHTGGAASIAVNWKAQPKHPHPLGATTEDSFIPGYAPPDQPGAGS